VRLFFLANANAWLCGRYAGPLVGLKQNETGVPEFAVTVRRDRRWFSAGAKPVRQMSRSSR
jgi:hypothetical protein